MTQDVVPFTFESQSVRAVTIDGEPWFVGADVCRALKLGNPRQALSRLDDDERNTVHIKDGNRGNPDRTIINEPGVYRLIFTSRRPEAERFKRWIAHDVLPEIRRTGSYRPRQRRDTRHVVSASIVSQLEAVFATSNQRSDWTEYVPLDHLQAAFPEAKPRQIATAMLALGFLSRPFPYLGDAHAFIRFTDIPREKWPEPEKRLRIRWVYDAVRRVWDLDLSMYLPRTGAQ